MSFQGRFRNAVAALMLGIALAGTASAQSGLKENGAKTPKGTADVKEIVSSVTPKGAPAPTFRYRLLPMVSELNSGDAAPIYLRLGYELLDGAVREADQKAIALLGLPFDQFPASEARTLVDRWSPQLRQISFGARRRTCDWNYTLLEESDHIITIRLPDAQNMRVWARLVALKARAEIAEGKLEEAIRTIQTGLAFGRHVAEGPFFINVLIGTAIANLMLERVDELIGRSEAPNLYWAITALPRPLISMRDSAETEQAVAERLVPELAEADRPRSGAEWAALLARLHVRLIEVEKLLWPEGPKGDAVPPDLGAFRSTMLPKARSFLKTHQVEASSDDEAIIRAIVGSQRELFDDYFKGAYLPYPDSITLEREVGARVIAAKSGPAAVFTGWLPAVQSVHMAEARLDRKVAALRIIEAVRWHAAGHDGQLPESLDQIKVVPIPSDPMNGKPFEYRREGDSAVLTEPVATSFRLVYRITVRK